MIRGMYTALSGMIVEEKKQTVVSNNMANANTFGYKTKKMNVKSFEQVMLENKDVTRGQGKNSLGKTSYGVEIDDVTIDTSQGAFKQTDSATDLALEGKGYFLVKGGDDKRFYTRNGKFAKDIMGDLVDSNGNKVIGKDKNGKEVYIHIGNKDFNVNHKGEVFVDKNYLCDLKIVDFKNKQDMVKIGENLFFNKGDEQQGVALVKQGNLEMSNVNISDEYTNMITAYRSFETNYKVLSKINETLGKSVTEIGRVR